MREGAVTKTRRSFARSEAAGVMVEFTLVFPLLVALLFLVVDIMMTLFVDAAMENALRIASRHGMTGFAEAGESREVAICRAIDERTLGFVRCGDAATSVRVAAFDSFEAAAAFDPDEPVGEGPDDPPPVAAGAAGQVVVYTVTYRPPAWTPAAILLGGSAIATLSARTVVRNEKW
jgi:Flp pilus assembly protein TadG